MSYQFYIKKKNMKQQAEILLEAMKEKYKADLIIGKMETYYSKKIKDTLIKELGNIEKTYKSMAYEFYDLKVDISIYSINIKNVGITILYTTKSKLIKVRRDRLNEIKNDFSSNNHGHVDYSQHKKPLWFTEFYKLNFEDMLEERFNLIH